MIFDQANTNYINSGTISDGATIAASGIQLTNNEFGRIYGGVTFATGGSTLINELGGVISLSQSEGTDFVLVFGSNDGDTLINGGLINGRVDLGLGDDIFVDRDGGFRGVNLSAGNDTYRVEKAEATFLGFVAGGTGQDRVVMAGSANQYWGDNLSGFEQLVLETGGNFWNFSGYSSITITGALPPATFYNLVECLNPAVDIAVGGHSLLLHRSSLHSITGGDQSDWVQIGFGNTIAAGILLGGGDDQLTLDSFREPNALPIDFTANGGSGIDTLMLTWFAAGDRAFDLSSIQGFEKLNVNAWYIVDAATARVSNISGLTDIDVGQNVTLIVSDSDIAQARIGGALGGGVTLEVGVVANRYGFPEDGSWDNRLDIVQGDPTLSTKISNHGTITGDVKFYIGDDYYDGRGGTVGGTIYGNAGNDTIIGGSGRETMVGGYGADVLTGGAGNDIFHDTAAGHNGDTITDFSRGDVIVISDAALAGFSFKLSGNTLTYTGGSLTLSNPTAAALQFNAAAGGGVQITFASPPIVISGSAPVAPAIPVAAKAVAIGQSALDGTGSSEEDSFSGSHAIWRASLDNADHWGGHVAVSPHPAGDWLGQDIFQ